jgi:hypothetical protein
VEEASRATTAGDAGRGTMERRRLGAIGSQGERRRLGGIGRRPAVAQEAAAAEGWDGDSGLSWTVARVWFLYILPLQ